MKQQGQNYINNMSALQQQSQSVDNMIGNSQHYKSISENDFQQIPNKQQISISSEMFNPQEHLTLQTRLQSQNSEENPKRSANRMQQRLQGGNNPLAGQIVQRGQSKNLNSPDAKSQQLQNQFMQMQQPPLYKQNSSNNLFSSNSGALIQGNQNNIANKNGLCKSITINNGNLCQINNQTNRTNLSGLLLTTTNQDVMIYTQNSQNNYTDEDIVNIQNQNSLIMNYDKPNLVHSSSTNSMNHQGSTNNIHQNNIFQNNGASNSQISMPQTVQSRNLCEGCRVGAKQLFSQQKNNLSMAQRNNNGQSMQQISHHHQSVDEDQQLHFEIQELRQQVDELNRLLEEKNYENEQLKQQIQILQEQLQRISETHNEVLNEASTYSKEIEKLNQILTQTNAEKKKKEENENVLKQEIKYLVDKLLKAKEKIEQKQQDQSQIRTNETSSQNLITENSGQQNQYSSVNQNKLINQHNYYLTNNQPISPQVKISSNTNHNNSSSNFSEIYSNIGNSTIGNKFNLDSSIPNKYTSVNYNNTSGYNSKQGQFQNTELLPPTQFNSKAQQQQQAIKNQQLSTSVNMSQMLNQSKIDCVNQSLCLNGSTKSPGFLNFIHQNKENSSFQTRKNGINEEKNLFGGYEKSPTSNFNLGKSTELIQKGISNNSQYSNNQSSSFINNFNSNTILDFDHNQSYNNNVSGMNLTQQNQNSQKPNNQQINNDNIIQNQPLFKTNLNQNACRSERKGQSNLKNMIQKEEERSFQLRSKTPFTSRFNQSFDKSNIPIQDTSQPFEQTKKQLFSSDNNNNTNQVKNLLKPLQQMRRLDIPKQQKPSYLFD